jgi:hypothetical protein
MQKHPKEFRLCQLLPKSTDASRDDQRVAPPIRELKQATLLIHERRPEVNRSVIDGE